MRKKASTQNMDLVRERRRLIIQAAIVVFRKYGFHVATTHDIAAEAGLTQSNLYNYIKSKDDVLFLVCDHLVSLYIDALDRIGDSDADPYARLTGALREIISIMSRHRDEVQLLYHETHSLNKKHRREILASIAKLIARFETLASDYVDAYGGLNVKTDRIAANLMTFVPAVVALRWWDLNKYASREEVESVVYEFVVNGLGLHAAKPRLARAVATR